MNNVIGIDGGGTKTVAVMANRDGNIIAAASGGPSNPNTMTEGQLQTTLGLLLKQLQQQAAVDYEKVTALFAGMSGAAGKRANQQIHGVLSNNTAPEVICKVVPDPINALYAGTYGKEGIVQIAGTGSVTYGINAIGDHARSGGWGYLFGDGGSGYDLGRRAIIAVLEHEDGIGEATLLHSLFIEHFQVHTARAILEKIYMVPAPKQEVSRLTKLIFHAYHEKDAVTVEILHHAAKEMAQHILSVQGRLFGQGICIPLILTGGVFTDRSVLPKLLEKELAVNPDLLLRIPEIPPVGGSIIGAFTLLHERIDEQFISTLKQSFHHNHF